MKWLNYIVNTILLVLLIYFTWILDRGFEMTDEAYYLHHAMYPSSVKAFNSAQQWFTAPLWYITGNLFLFRAVGMLILLISSGILAYGIINVSPKIFKVETIQFRERSIIICTTLIAALLYGSTINFSPCYNLISSSSAYAVVGLTLLAVDRVYNYKVILVQLLAGCVLSIAFLNKVSSGLCLLMLGLIFVIAFNKTWRKAFSQLAFLFAGLIISSCLFILFHPGNIVQQFSIGMEIFKSVQTEPVIHRLDRYTQEIKYQVIWSAAYLVLPLAFMSHFSYPKIFLKARKAALILALIIGCYFLIQHFTWKFKDVLSGHSLSFTLVLSLLLISTIGIWTRNMKAAILVCGLIALPYCAVAGTGSSLIVQIILAFAPWGTVIALLTVVPEFKGNKNIPAVVCCLLFVLLIPAHVMYSAASPYRLNSAIWNQDIPTKIGEIGNIKTDKATHDFVLAIRAAVDQNGISGGSSFLGFYNLPGTAVILTAVPVFWPWLINIDQSQLILDKVDSKILAHSIIGIMLNVDGSMPQLPGQFYDFPKGFRLLCEAIYPANPYLGRHIQLWIPAL